MTQTNPKHWILATTTIPIVGLVTGEQEIAFYLQPGTIEVNLVQKEGKEDASD